MKIAALALTSLAAVQAQTPIAVTFLHINDHHSHFEELSFDIRDSDFIPDTLGVNSTNIRMFYGGFPRTVGLMTALSEDAVAAGNDVIKVHAGDALTGTIFYTFFGPKMDAAAMNAASFDAFVVGNHEFDEGDNNLAEFIEMLDPPALSSNRKSTLLGCHDDPDSVTLLSVSVFHYLTHERTLFSYFHLSRSRRDFGPSQLVCSKDY